MGGVCGFGSIKGRLSPIESLSGTLSIPVGGTLDCDIYDGEYTVTPSDTVQILPTANKLLKQDISAEKALYFGIFSFYNRNNSILNHI